MRLIEVIIIIFVINKRLINKKYKNKRESNIKIIKKCGFN